VDAGACARLKGKVLQVFVFSYFAINFFFLGVFLVPYQLPQSPVALIGFLLRSLFLQYLSAET
jgi:hypothetical protein